MLKYRIYIKSHSGKTKLYWNRFLQAWVESVGNASPFNEDEFKGGPYAPLPYGAKTEVVNMNE